MDKRERSGAIRAYGRTLAVFPLGEVGTVIRPAWCRGKTETRRTG